MRIPVFVIADHLHDNLLEAGEWECLSRDLLPLHAWGALEQERAMKAISERMAHNADPPWEIYLLDDFVTLAPTLVQVKKQLDDALLSTRGQRSARRMSRWHSTDIDHIVFHHDDHVRNVDHIRPVQG